MALTNCTVNLNSSRGKHFSFFLLVMKVLICLHHLLQPFQGVVTFKRKLFTQMIKCPFKTSDLGYPLEFDSLLRRYSLPTFSMLFNIFTESFLVHVTSNEKKYFYLLVLAMYGACSVPFFRFRWLEVMCFT